MTKWNTEKHLALIAAMFNELHERIAISKQIVGLFTTGPAGADRLGRRCLAGSAFQSLHGTLNGSIRPRSPQNEQSTIWPTFIFHRRIALGLSPCDPDSFSNTDPLSNPNSYSDADSDSLSNPNSYSDADSDSLSGPNSYSNADADSFSDPNSYSNADADSFSNTIPFSDVYP